MTETVSETEEEGAEVELRERGAVALTPVVACQ